MYNRIRPRTGDGHLPSRTPVREIDRAVNIFNDNDGFRSSLHEEFPELRIRMNLSKLKIINIIAKKVSHGSNQTRFPSTWRSIKKIPTFPSSSSLLIKSLAISEISKIKKDLKLASRIKSQSIKSARMFERNRLPRVATGVKSTATGVSEKKTILVEMTELGGGEHDVIEIALKNNRFVLLLDGEGEATLLIRDGTPGKGWILPLSDDVFPGGGGAIEGVNKLVVVREGVSEGRRVESSAKAQPAS